MASLYLTRLASKFKDGEEPERWEVRFRGADRKTFARFTGFDSKRSSNEKKIGAIDPPLAHMTVPSAPSCRKWL